VRYLRWVHSPNWPADVGSGLVAGLLASFIVVAVLAWRSEWVADRTLEANPSCAAPRGVVPVKVDRASGAEAPNDGAARKEFGYRASNAVDDASESMWIPPLVPMSTADTELAGRSPRFVKGQNANVLTLRLDHEADIRLVCVVNGASLWFTSYQNWGRVRTVEVWGHDHDDAHFGILRSLGSDDFPQRPAGGAEPRHHRHGAHRAGRQLRRAARRDVQPRGVPQRGDEPSPSRRRGAE